MKTLLAFIAVPGALLAIAAMLAAAHSITLRKSRAYRDWYYTKYFTLNRSGLIRVVILSSEQERASAFLALWQRIEARGDTLCRYAGVVLDIFEEGGAEC